MTAEAMRTVQEVYDRLIRPQVHQHWFALVSTTASMPPVWATDIPNRAVLHYLARNVLARIPRVDAAEGQHLLERERACVTSR